MANTLYYANKPLLLNGGVLPLTDTLCMALLGSGYTPSDAHTTWSDVSANEISGVTNYTAGGVVLASKQVLTDAVNKRAYFTSASALWTTVTLTARWVVLYKRAGGSPTGTDKILVCYDLGGATSASNGNFEFIPNSTNGWLYI